MDIGCQGMVCYRPAIYHFVTGKLPSQKSLTILTLAVKKVFDIQENSDSF